MEISFFFETANGRIALEEAHFRVGSEFRVARRGALFTYNTSPFRWVPFVCALSLAFVRAKMLHLSDELHEVLLAGGPGTPARTLYRSVYRNDFRFWDLFGVTQSGRPRIFEILHFARPSSAVARNKFKVCFLRGKLAPEKIEIFLERRVVNSSLELSLLYGGLEVEFYKLLQVKQSAAGGEFPVNTEALPTL